MQMCKGSLLSSLNTFVPFLDRSCTQNRHTVLHFSAEYHRVKIDISHVISCLIALFRYILMPLGFNITDYTSLKLNLAFCSVAHVDSSTAYILFICNDIIKHSSHFSKQSKRVYGIAPCSNSLFIFKDLLTSCLPSSKNQYSLNKMVVQAKNQTINIMG